jgi:hypothetical protein
VPADVPLWFLVMDAAGGDPLRAQAIYENVSRDWWEYFKLYRTEQGKHSKEQKRKFESK